MEKEITVSGNNHMLLELLYMMDYCKFSDTINDKIDELKKIIQKEMFGNFFDEIGNHDIAAEELKLKYTFE